MTESTSCGCSAGSLCQPLQRAAASCSNVLVVGEDGSGKGFAARILHRMSPRASGPLVVLAPGALAEEDIESELFGDGARGGKVAEARGGTLFLDEIADLPLRVQARLVRVLDRREELDVRIVAATQHDLSASARAGSFRADLLHRVAVVTIELVPLRQRSGDIPILARMLLQDHAARLRKNVRTISPAAMTLLAAHSWPGNVRELSNVIEQAVVLASNDAITSDDLRRDVRDALAAHAPPVEHGDDESASSDLEGATLAFQKRHVARILTACGGHRARAARLLGVSPATFFRHLRKLDLKAASGGSRHV